MRSDSARRPEFDDVTLSGNVPNGFAGAAVEAGRRLGGLASRLSEPDRQGCARPVRWRRGAIESERFQRRRVLSNMAWSHQEKEDRT